MSKIIGSLMGLLAIPVMVLNFAGLIVGGVWLLIIGQWKVALVSAGLTFFGGYILMAPLMVALLFASLGAFAERKGWHKTLNLMAVFHGLCVVATMWFWACASLASFVKLSSLHASAVPFLLCSYAVATAPWQDMSQKEASGPGGFNPSQTLAGFLSMSYVIALGVTLFELPLIFPFSIIGGTLLFGLVLNLKMASDIQKMNRKYGFQAF